jgi:hypothetical protein
MPRYIYVGPIDAVDVPILGRTLTRGDEFDVDDDAAHLFDEQPDNYQPAED